LRHWDDAISHYREAVARHKDQSRYAANLGRVLVIMGQLVEDRRDEWFSQAVEAYLEEQRNNRMGLDPLRQLGTAYHIWGNLSKEEAAREKRFDLAEQFYTEAIRLSPNMAILWTEWALSARDRGLLDTAVERLARAKNLCPGYDVTCRLMADIHVAQKDWPEARDCYLEATIQNAAEFDGWTGLAFACSRVGDLDCALEASLRALEIRSDDLPTRFNVALLFSKSGDRQQALVLAERAIAEAPPHADAAVTTLLQELFSMDSD
jgi:tetratricopeptide (TPR) repeat protein